jgi:1-acyl-sn-glycerol-3-phosphate acyltransferase
MIVRLRNILFALVFWTGSVPIVLFAPVGALFGRRVLRVYVRGWVKYHVWCARIFLGITVRVEGPKPTGQVLYVAKHQSMFDAIIAPDLFQAPVIVLKRELADIPVWGWAAKRYGAIAVDREASSVALRRMLREAAAARTAGRSVLIFPEGTRVAAGEQPPLRPGFAGLYRSLNLPMVTIANDSGRLWPRKGLKLPGVVTFRYGEPVPPGLPRDEAEARAHAGINVLDTAAD